MAPFNPATFELGVLGGGQLGKMLIQAASRWHLNVHVLDPADDCPASLITQHHTTGSFRDYKPVMSFGRNLNRLTIEIEDVNTEALKELQGQGKIIHPDPAILEIIKDKGLQKQFYYEHKIPTADFSLFKNQGQLLSAIKSGAVRLPLVQKLRHGGYDGRGVQVIEQESDLGHLFDEPSLAEDLVDIDKEISVIAARNAGGEVVCYPAVEMVFNPRANLVEYLVAPVSISEELAREAEVLAKKTIRALGLAGLLAVEMFVDTNGKLWVNEVAPRPHNSGHHTIESCHTSQFEQHLRAIFNWPLGNTDLTCNAVMINLLGTEGHRGVAQYEAFDKVLDMQGVHVHLYGKIATRPFRKMGHITVLDDEREKAIEKAKYIQGILKVIS